MMSRLMEQSDYKLRGLLFVGLFFFVGSLFFCLVGFCSVWFYFNSIHTTAA